jgi:hypothetical protein
MQGAASASFSIEIDATALFYRQFIVIGSDSSFVDSRQVRSLQLDPGSYPIQVQSGVYTDFSFEVTDAGVIDFDAAFDGFATGRGSTRLTLTGLEIGVDARGLSSMAGGGVLFASIPLTNDDWIGFARVRLLPQTIYMLQQGSGVVCDLSFALGIDGLIHYTAEQDWARGGCLSGDGTDTLTLHGFGLRIDASAVSRVLALPNVWGLQPSFNGRLDVTVLPAASFVIQLDAGVSDAVFMVGPTGVVAPANSPADLRMVVEAGRVPLLRVLPPAAPTIEPLNDVVYDFSNFRIVIGVDAQGAERVSMETDAATPWFVDRRWLAGSPAFTVHATGNVRPVGQPAPPDRLGRLTVTLAGSQWPGTELSTDFTLIVVRNETPDGEVIIVSMHWTLGGGDFNSDESWDGNASAMLTLSGQVAALGPQGSIDLASDAPVQVNFRPGSLNLTGGTVARVTRPDGVLSCGALQLDAADPGAGVLLDGDTRAQLHAALSLQANASWPIALPGSQTPLGALERMADRFDSALVELGENPDGRRRQAAQFVSSAPDTAFALSIDALTDARAQPLVANLARCLLFFNHDSDPPLARLRGLATTADSWVEAQGVGLHFGALPFTAQNNLDIGFDDATVSAIDVQLGFGGVLLPLDGFVVEPFGAPALIALLPPGSTPDPAQQRNALVVGAAAVGAAPLMLRDYAFGLLRPQDLLRLRFDFVGRRLRAGTGQTPTLEAEAPGQAGTMVVGLPPQHRAEAAFAAGASLPPLPLSMRLGRESRLAFALATADPLPLSPDFLLAWAAHTLSVAPVCSDSPPSGLVPAEPAGINGSGSPLTAVELPYRLLLSPGAGASFAHSVQPAQQGPWIELWNTRLAARRASAAVPGGFLPDERSSPANDAACHLRVLWSPDYTADLLGGPDLPFVTPLTSRQRALIVDASADTQRIGGPGMALETGALALSSLGGWLHAEGHREADSANDLVAWTHIAALGRDQHVQVVERGVLYPFGHAANKVTITDREFAGDTNNTAALKQQTVLQIIEPVRHYHDLPADSIFANLELGLRSTPPVEFLTIYTPPDAPQDVRASWVGDFFQFPLRGHDQLGNIGSFSAAAIFITRSGLADPAAMSAASAAYAAQGGAAARSTLDGQRLAFAPEGQPGDTSFETRFLDFADGSYAGSSYDLPFYPRIAAARIELSAVRALSSSVGGLAEGVEAAFTDAYLSQGFDPTGNPAQALFSLADPTSGQPISIGFEGDKALGVASPSMTIGSLSRNLGTLPADPSSMFPAGQPSIDLSNFFPADASLLGGIPLTSVISCVIPPPVTSDPPPPPGAPSEVPVVKSETLGTGVNQQLVTRLSWQPRIKPDAPPIGPGGLLELHLNARGSSSFSLLSTHTIQLDPTSPTPGSVLTQGSLTQFDLAFGPSGAALVTVQFNEFSFTAQDGRKPDTHLSFDTPPIVLGGDLEFLKVLIDALRDILGGGPAVNVSATQIVAGYAIAVPQLSIGIFSLSNIAIGAGVTIPLSGGAPTSFRFNFAEEHHPFNLTVSLLGGGGYFALALDSTGIQAIDFAVEAGASVSLDLAGLASGSAHVMLGASFHFSPTSFALGGYLRAGGELTVLGVLSLHVEFYAGFVYKREPTRQYLHASVSVMVEVTVACLSQSVTLTLERDFDVGGGASEAITHVRALVAPTAPGVVDLMSADDWAAYAAAFA